MIDDFVVFGDFDFFLRTDGFDFSVLNQNRSISDRITGASEDLAQMDRYSGWFFFIGFISRQHRPREDAHQ